MNDSASALQGPVRSRDNAWTDLVLTLPILLLYHVGVVFLPVRNAADWVTASLVDLADRSLFSYLLVTATVGAAVVVFFLFIGQKRALRWQRFAMIAAEGVVYAVTLRVVAGYVVGQLRLDSSGIVAPGPFTGLVMSLGAGFYEELVFRVGIFGLLGQLVYLAAVAAPKPWKKALFWLGWAVVSSFLFSAWHHVGELGESFTLEAFAFRWVAGLVFTLILALRGFATVVWTHTLYDVWVMVL
ncbi:MAG: CPBP family glutamic-type intramembrane protease [Polyangiaceae bacterium]